MTFDPNIYVAGAAFVALSLGGVAVMWADRNERHAKRKLREANDIIHTLNERNRAIKIELKVVAREAEKANDTYHHNIEWHKLELAKARYSAQKRRKRISRALAQVTDHPNATVNRMARILRGELDGVDTKQRKHLNFVTTFHPPQKIEDIKMIAAVEVEMKAAYGRLILSPTEAEKAVDASIGQMWAVSGRGNYFKSSEYANVCLERSLKC